MTPAETFDFFTDVMRAAAICGAVMYVIYYITRILKP